MYIYEPLKEYFSATDGFMTWWLNEQEPPWTSIHQNFKELPYLC